MFQVISLILCIRRVVHAPYRLKGPYIAVSLLRYTSKELLRFGGEARRDKTEVVEGTGFTSGKLDDHVQYFLGYVLGDIHHGMKGADRVVYELFKFGRSHGLVLRVTQKVLRYSVGPSHRHLF